MDLHFEGNKLYYMEKEAELYAALQIVSKELNGQESMTKEEVWDVFNILIFKLLTCPSNSMILSLCLLN